MELVLITGGAVRIGRAIALTLGRAGFAAAIQYNRSQDEAEKTASDIRALGSACNIYRANLADPSEVAGLFPAINAAMGRAAVLINNASDFSDDRIDSLGRDTFRTSMAVNLEAPIFLARDFGNQLPDAGSGNIVIILDQRVLRPNPMFFSYTLSKSALWTATTTMSQALAPKVRVNAVAPGPTLKNAFQTAHDFNVESCAVPLGRGPTPEEIADAILFILRSPAMTGQTLTLDGGQHLLWQTPDVGVT